MFRFEGKEAATRPSPTASFKKRPRRPFLALNNTLRLRWAEGPKNAMYFGARRLAFWSARPRLVDETHGKTLEM
jgi:hypothetical protein